MEERRAVARIDAAVPVVVTPLSDVATRWPGRVMNLSRYGVKVHVEAIPGQLPRPGDAYRVQSGKDVILCEVRHYQIEDEGSNLGFKIIHWGSAGELDRLIKGLK